MQSLLVIIFDTAFIARNVIVLRILIHDGDM